MTTGLTSYASAIGAYRTAARAADTPAAPAEPAGSVAPAQSGFADLVRDAARTAAEAAETGEQLAMQAVTGGSPDLSAVVTAVAEAEVTLRAVVAVRDRVIEAYREVIRMPV